MFEQIFENVRQKHPLIHNITNYVTVNDCANMLLACGGSPIMADELEDAVELPSISVSRWKAISPHRPIAHTAAAAASRGVSGLAVTIAAVSAER